MEPADLQMASHLIHCTQASVQLVGSRRGPDAARPLLSRGCSRGAMVKMSCRESSRAFRMPKQNVIHDGARRVCISHASCTGGVSCCILMHVHPTQ